MNKKSQAKRLQLWFGIVNILREALAKGHRRYIFASIGVHILVVVLMSWSWHSSDAVKTFEIPSSVQARVLTAAEIDELPYKQRERKQAADQKLKKELELKKKKELEVKKKRAQEKQRKLEADKKRKQEQDKKRILAEKKKAEALKAEKTKQELERKKQAAETKRLEQQKAEEAARKDAEIQDRVKKREQELEQLETIAERREQALRDKLLADRLAAMKELNASANNAPVAFDLDEKTRYLSIIKSRIESRWYVPPNSGRSYVVLRIQLLPSGELSSVKVIESSGNAALDQSALAAVRAVNKFEVPKEQRFFDEYFRSFQMSFKPPE
jgi:colicin import membrane protein